MARHIILKMAKIEGKEYTLNAAKRNAKSHIQEVSVSIS